MEGPSFTRSVNASFSLVAASPNSLGLPKATLQQIAQKSEIGRTMACQTRRKSSTVQPLRVVQPDAVCEVGGSTPDLSHGGTWGFSLGEAKQRNLYIS